jgi:hypothetical protein
LNWCHVENIWAEDEVKCYDTIENSGNILEWDNPDVYEKSRRESVEGLIEKSRRLVRRIKWKLQGRRPIGLTIRTPFIALGNTRMKWVPPMGEMIERVRLALRRSQIKTLRKQVGSKRQKLSLRRSKISEERRPSYRVTSKLIRNREGSRPL